MQQALDFEHTQQLLGGTRIPPAPAILLELQEILQQDEPELGRMSDAIERDPGIASLVLKTVNSSFFGLRNKVNSIRQATSLLGLSNISNIVAGLALRRALEESGGVPPEYWDSPANVAMVAATLAQRFGEIPPDEAYMLGLFHNAGEVLMMQRFDDYVSLLHEVREGDQPQLAMEEERYATNHAVVGYFISSSWGLPQHVQEVILRHHDASDYLAEDGGSLCLKRTLMASLKMAEYIDACYWGRRENLEWHNHGDAVLHYLGVSSLEFLDVTDDMVELLIAAQG